MNLWIIFFTGLTTGGLSCLAMQGGLLTSVIANQKEQELEDLEQNKAKAKDKKRRRYLQKLQKKKMALGSFDQLDWMPVTMFLGAKLLSHTLFAFVLGTLPLFALRGVATAKLSEGWHQKFMKFAAYGLVAMALYSVNGVLVVMDSPLTLQKITRPITYFFSNDRFATAQAVGSVVNGVQQVTINVESRGYSPNRFAVNVGQPVELTLVSNGVYSCASYFNFPAFGIRAQLKPTDSQTFTFTPKETGTFTFSCSMGMYSGVMIVQ